MNTLFVSFLHVPKNAVRACLVFLLLPLMLMWQGCPNIPIDNCFGTSPTVIKARVTYSLIYTTPNIASDSSNTKVAATWNASSPTGRYKVVVTAQATANAPTVTIRDTITTRAEYTYYTLRQRESNNTITVVALGADGEPCNNTKGTLKIANPNGGTITIDIVGRQSTITGSCSYPLSPAPTTAQFCSPAKDLFKHSKTFTAPNASKIIVNLCRDGQVSPLKTYTYNTGWGGVPVYFQPLPANNIATWFTSTDGLQTYFGTTDNIDFSLTPTSYTIQYPS